MSGSSGGVFSGSGGGAGPTETPTGLLWAVKKVKLLEFSGFDPQGWIQNANLYFDINKTPDDLRIRLAQLSMVGGCSTLVYDHCSEIQNPYEQLATIKQSDLIHDYNDDFEYLLSLVPRLPESQALGYFIAGLQDDVKRWVDVPGKGCGRDATSQFLLGKRVSFTGVRSLSRTEWEERCKKGLCYKCGQPFSPAHKCPEGQLRVLLLGDDESDGLEGLHFQLEHRDNFHSDGVIQKAVESPIKS
ncbi:hypothetical protein E3N88_24245 [Mikania micrantha]|uniref:Retrotransposon gag domain-containing protein n=1 Tax=Mikania micrantha TaxID=192012 RepID=A0A5N6NFR5_9ASTR|nr:hypothetical protein E3N88_24245 [Mikania micrantha]